MKYTNCFPLRGILLCLMLSLLASSNRSIAQDKQLSGSEMSYRRARQTLEAGLHALGGLEAVSTIKSFSVIERRKGHDDFQNPTPGPPYNEYNAVEKLLVDLAGSRLWHELEVNQPRYSWGSLTIINDKQGYQGWMNSLTRGVTPLNAPSLDDHRHLFQKLPQFFLLDALRERAASLRWLGEGEAEGRKQEIITFIDQEQSADWALFRRPRPVIDEVRVSLHRPGRGRHQIRIYLSGLSRSGPI